MLVQSHGSSGSADAVLKDFTIIIIMMIIINRRYTCISLFLPPRILLDKMDLLGFSLKYHYDSNILNDDFNLNCFVTFIDKWKSKMQKMTKIHFRTKSVLECQK